MRGCGRTSFVRTLSKMESIGIPVLQSKLLRENQFITGHVCRRMTDPVS